MSETDLEDRMVSFDCIMKVIARHKSMCTSAPMLEFLGFSVISDKNYFKVGRYIFAINGDCIHTIMCGVLLLSACSTRIPFRVH